MFLRREDWNPPPFESLNMDAAEKGCMNFMRSIGSIVAELKYERTERDSKVNNARWDKEIQ